MLRISAQAEVNPPPAHTQLLLLPFFPPPDELYALFAAVDWDQHAISDDIVPISPTGHPQLAFCVEGHPITEPHLLPPAQLPLLPLVPALPLALVPALVPIARLGSQSP